jgi:hypothetical protein
LKERWRREIRGGVEVDWGGEDIEVLWLVMGFGFGFGFGSGSGGIIDDSESLDWDSDGEWACESISSWVERRSELGFEFGHGGEE